MKIKCYVEIFKKGDTPMVSLKKPLAREIKASKEFGYETWQAELTLKKKL